LHMRIAAVSSFAAIIAAAGKSARFHDKHYKKPFISLADRAVWLHSAERFLNRADTKQVILVISPEDKEDFHSKFAANVAILGIDVVDGGETRSESVGNGLAKVNPDMDFVAVHDAARPCLADQWIDAVFEAAVKHQAAILAIPVNGTLKRVSSGQQITETVPREGLWEAQTPQVFDRQLLIDAYAAHGADHFTDEAQLVEKHGHPVHVVPGSPINLKITTRADLNLAKHTLKAMPKPTIFGHSHPFEDDDKWR